MPEAEKTTAREEAFVEQVTIRAKVAFRKSWFRLPSLESDIRWAIEDPTWQQFRGQRLKNLSTTRKLELLTYWLECWHHTDYERNALAQVLNYLRALKRGGQIRESQMLGDDKGLGVHRGVAGETWEILK